MQVKDIAQVRVYPPTPSLQLASPIRPIFHPDKSGHAGSVPTITAIIVPQF
jgi:hypothetical protein